MAVPLSNIIGSQIIKARERIGWTQADLAKYTGIGRATLYRYEAGERSGIHPVNLIKIADATGVTVDFLLGRDGIAQRIKRARALKKMTQQELADILGVPIATVRRYESAGDIGVDQTRLPDIARSTGVSMDFLLGGLFSLW